LLSVSKTSNLADLTSQRPQQTTFSSTPMSTSLSPPINSLLERKPTIRERLQQWQEKNGTPNFDILSSFENHPRVRDVTNDLTRIGSSEASNTQSYEDDETEEYETLTDLHTTSLYLQPGDLAEIL